MLAYIPAPWICHGLYTILLGVAYLWKPPYGPTRIEVPHYEFSKARRDPETVEPVILQGNELYKVVPQFVS